jgi:hypothetical protein
MPRRLHIPRRVHSVDFEDLLTRPQKPIAAVKKRTASNEADFKNCVGIPALTVTTAPKNRRKFSNGFRTNAARASCQSDGANPVVRK